MAAKRTPDTFPLAAPTGKPMQIGLLLRTPYLASEHEIDRRLRLGRFRDIRPAHYVVFQVLSQTGSRLTELAAKANMTKQSMQYLVDDLEAAGYLKRSPDPADSRAQIIQGTAKAARLYEAVEQMIGDIEADWAARMGKADFAELKRLLGHLNLCLKGA